MRGFSSRPTPPKELCHDQSSDGPLPGFQRRLPKKLRRDDIPKIDHYPDVMTTLTPRQIDFKPDQLLGSVSLSEVTTSRGSP